MTETDDQGGILVPTEFAEFIEQRGIIEGAPLDLNGLAGVPPGTFEWEAMETDGMIYGWRGRPAEQPH